MWHVERTGCGFYEWWTAQKDCTRPLNNDTFIAHRGYVCTAGRATTHDDGNLRDSRRGHRRLVVEFTTKMFLVREDLCLQRQKGTARVNHVNTWQAIFTCDFLGPQMLFDGHGKVRPTFHCRIVTQDHTFDPVNTTDTRDYTRRWDVWTVHVKGATNCIQSSYVNQDGVVYGHLQQHAALCPKKFTNARGENSKKGLLGSNKESMRSRTNIFPRETCLARALSPPPRRARSNRV